MKFRLLLILFFLFFPLFIFAQTGKFSNYGMDITAKQGDASKAFNTDLSNPRGYIVETLGGITGTILSFVGLIFLILIVYSGILWMTARGNDQQIEKSKKTMIWSSIGIVAVFASFAFVQFLGVQLTKSIHTNEEFSSPTEQELQDPQTEEQEPYDLAEAFNTCLIESKPYTLESHRECFCKIYGGENCESD